MEPRLGTPLEIQRFSEAPGFLERAEPYLLRDEACHHLILGIGAGLMQGTLKPSRPPYLATCEAEGEVVAAAVMTPPHGLVVSKAPDEALRLIARDLYEGEEPLPGVHGPADESRRFAAEWQALTGQSARADRPQRIYQVEELIEPVGVSGALRRATRADLDLISHWLRDFNAETGAPNPSADEIIAGRLESPTGGLYLWLDPEPVSLVGHTGPTRHGVRIGPVYTPPEWRRHGYAAAATAALCRTLLGSGRRFCFLYTDQSNRTAQRVYERIGFRPVCDIAEYRFDAAEHPG